MDIYFMDLHLVFCMTNKGEGELCTLILPSGVREAGGHNFPGVGPHKVHNHNQLQNLCGHDRIAMHCKHVWVVWKTTARFSMNV